MEDWWALKNNNDLLLFQKYYLLVLGLWNNKYTIIKRKKKDT